jgi:CubicO group peptidase (beta-lactamase class C family)
MKLNDIKMKRLSENVPRIFLILIFLQSTSLVYPIHCSEPDIDSVIADLQTFIPEYIRSHNVPGVGISLVKNGRIVYNDGFGVSNSIKKSPVTANTLFEVASISKVITAYIALRLVDEGKIPIDKPLHCFLKEEWLPPSQFRDSIKLTHVLSHSSGLSKTSREIMFKPGTAYYYSANGFNLTKEVMEQATGETLEELATRLVFEPLGMKNSSFARRDDLVNTTSNGHIRAIVPVALSIIICSANFLIILIIGLLIIRFRTKSWRIRQSQVSIFIVLALLIFIFIMFFFLGKSSLIEFALLFSITGVISLVLFLLSFFAGKRFMQKVIQKRWVHKVVLTIWAIFIITITGFISSKVRNVPVPVFPDYNVSAAGSVRTSPAELTKFMLELANPQYLSTEMSQYLRMPQIKLSDDLSWGMGPGILYTDKGYALWQWGQHIDFQSIMVVFPDNGSGVVVCTNNDLLNPDVALEIAERALGKEIEPLRAAIHLEYDYSD